MIEDGKKEQEREIYVDYREVLKRKLNYQISKMKKKNAVYFIPLHIVIFKIVKNNILARKQKIFFCSLAQN
jgi:hypothetical protein